MKKLLILLLVASILLCSCDMTPTDSTTFADTAQTIAPESETDLPSGFNSDIDLTEIPFITAARDDVIGITWYFDEATVRTLKDNVIYGYIGVYDTGRVTFRIRLQYFGEKKLGVNRFSIIAGGEYYDVVAKSTAGNNAVYYWEYMDTACTSQILKTIRAAASTDGEVKVRAYGADSSFNERVMGSSELTALRDVLFIYESIIGSEITYPVDIITETTDTSVYIPETTRVISDTFEDNITQTDGALVLDYFDYSISFPIGYSCTLDSETGAVSIVKTASDAEKIELTRTEGAFKAESVTDEVVASTLEILKTRIPQAEINIYTGATLTQLDSHPAVKYAYIMKFAEMTVYITQYLVEYDSDCYSIAIAELTPEGEVFREIVGAINFK